MGGEITADLLTQYARAFAVDYPYIMKSGTICIIQEFFNFRYGLVYRQAVKVKFDSHFSISTYIIILSII